ncbi:D-glucuronyl C5-epimerase family protein [Bradyrhizobium sp. CIR3A]|uniref:D-glucuronyl C5-epimerase family protein n=1 Tax=Bradyrhizobium sp. CIR3A TaxID=2663838 RepID=UPI001606176E|nr:D-glucuronyl C5-epimerase family protein [Bradyrhizobium sp. CIR3A]MBB4258753.1 hypothetical protein [Bradyrhizobium sp. CIR3A]
MSNVTQVMFLRRAVNLAGNYVLAPLLGRSSTSTYWYLPDPANLRSEEDLARYHNFSPSPFYVVDYRTRTTYEFTSPDGILRLPYPDPIGPQINPEAAFQCALGWHDRYVLDGSDGAREQFFLYANYFAERQTPTGDFNYLFDWFENTAPWHSALAQSRGASMMLRAFLLSGDDRYVRAALLALDRFDVDCSAGGYQAIFEPEGVIYFEEYPKEKNAVINGFMASLFALYEIGHWLGDRRCRDLFDTGVRSLERMLPYYTLPWWTLYDRGADAGRNVHSPRYQKMVINYLKVLSILSKSPTLRHFRDQWDRLDTPQNRAKAYFFKARRKLLYR